MLGALVEPDGCVAGEFVDDEEIREAVAVDVGEAQVGAVSALGELDLGLGLEAGCGVEGAGDAAVGLDAEIICSAITTGGVC